MSSGMSTGLSMQTAQRMEMTMTPQMIQSMELLQMPIMELEQRIRNEQLENPTLEIAEIENLNGESGSENYAESLSPDSGSPDAYDAQPDRADIAQVREYNEEANPDIDVYSDHEPLQGLELSDEIDYNWDDHYQDNYSPAHGGSSDDEDVYDPIANAVARPPSLIEHLLTQLAETPMPERTRRLAAGIVQKLDANGWLTSPLSETIPEGEDPAAASELETALAEVQKLDPDGVGARNLSECLVLQLQNRPDATPAAEAIARDYLEDLAANRMPKIAKDLKIGLDEVKTATDLIRTLNPRPGAGFSEEPAIAVQPELIVDGDAETGFTVRLASGVQPQVSDFFTALFDNSRRGKILRERLESDPSRSEAFSQFRTQMRRSGLLRKFREKYNNAQWLVKAVAQREKTILAVATEIIKAQEEYLAQRVSAPAILFQQDIANKIGYDNSTVSRAIKDKYIDTPLGIKPLKDFFARASGVRDGAESSSSAEVLEKIRDMIENEDKRRPLRDNEIMANLAADGIVIKRRSIVNYREKLGYPSHSQRKEH